MNAPTQRMRRVNESLREVLAQSVLELKDPRLGFVTVTEVRTAPDLRSADVYYTSLPDEPVARQATGEGLQSAKALLRRRVGEQTRLKRTPELRFVRDPLPEQSARIQALLVAERRPSDDG